MVDNDDQLLKVLSHKYDVECTGANGVVAGGYFWLMDINLVEGGQMLCLMSGLMVI